MFINKKVKDLQDEVEVLRRELAEKDEQLAQKEVIIISQRKSYESLHMAYTDLLKKVRKTSALVNDDKEELNL